MLPQGAACSSSPAFQVSQHAACLMPVRHDDVNLICRNARRAGNLWLWQALCAAC